MKSALSALFAVSIVAGSAGALAEPARQAANAAYVPGLGDFMGNIQRRHAKLWFAVKARNWPLAAYEIDELKEGLEDVVKHHPDFDGKPIAQMLETVTAQPIAALEKIVDAKDTARFARAFDQLSLACNACHRASGRGFIVIQRPSSPPLTNQRFVPAR